ncbi:TPA: GNAT family N-acetyltransferase [Vibrio parahaemolyticus]|uniref:GNAT family N-acetyltransferase n=1 Tax=Vibrio parahaemolyticus TaxID=670 RepID=UPI0004655309|nr:GNAT family N-acetyltransferase [Vibrio parahaemolyticus]ELB2122198.1 GNAT family N-acetyltransferase [Vibrio parahaemolyticus]MBE4066568.1 GNAT family N-acetyltransferase [Vibrio parahaemolyticus]MBE4489898.1 GNAT family N-acetyltransferase [Vibrio parahaemolyticus]MBE4494578.1 GNAT family N-acetyltransferase [Vibrio parahaemolyticus]MBE4503461.1 GNAT family N-acetyltransferase [Vibrio parahaemolyticus]
MEIIRFQSHHYEATARIYFESRVATFSFMDTSGYSLADFAKDTGGEEIWVAVEQGIIVGFISIWKPENFIHHLFVCPKNLKRGIGFKLLSHAKELSNSLSLKSLVQNTNATDFYISQGFKIQETVDKGQESYHLMCFVAQT